MTRKRCTNRSLQTTLKIISKEAIIINYPYAIIELMHMTFNNNVLDHPIKLSNSPLKYYPLGRALLLPGYSNRTSDLVLPRYPNQ